ncbi:DNA-directed RNA polymerase II subunit RPB2 [Tanacetum coccineum]
MTLQPAEGRSRDGGLQFVEMERDCIIADGAARFLKERLFDQSDAYRVHGCEHCGLIAIDNLKNNSFECRICKNKIDIVQSTYAIACDRNYKTVFLDFASVSGTLMHIAPVLYVRTDKMPYDILEMMGLSRNFLLSTGFCSCYLLFQYMVVLLSIAISINGTTPLFLQVNLAMLDLLKYLMILKEYKLYLL